MAQAPRHSGFTLLELVLVLLIVSILLALTAPNLRGWSQAGKLRDAAQDFVAVAQFARVHSAASAKLVRLHVRLSGDEIPTYWLTEHDGFHVAQVQPPEAQDVSNDLARGDLPDGFRIELTVNDQPGRDYVDFYPNGRMDRATVRITSQDGDTIAVECLTPTDGFRIKQESPR